MRYGTKFEHAIKLLQKQVLVVIRPMWENVVNNLDDKEDDRATLTPLHEQLRHFRNVL